MEGVRRRGDDAGLARLRTRSWACWASCRRSSRRTCRRGRRCRPGRRSARRNRGSTLVVSFVCPGFGTRWNL